jgi:hypothetical protein
MGHNLSILSMSEFFETGCLLDQCREVTDWSLIFRGSGGVNGIRRGPHPGSGKNYMGSPCNC